MLLLFSLYHCDGDGDEKIISFLCAVDDVVFVFESGQIEQTVCWSLQRYDEMYVSHACAFNWACMHVQLLNKSFLFFQRFVRFVSRAVRVLPFVTLYEKFKVATKGGEITKEAFINNAKMVCSERASERVSGCARGVCLVLKKWIFLRPFFFPFLFA